MLRLYSEVWKDHKHIKPIDPEVPHIIARLRSKYNIVILTASVAEESELKAWLEENGISYDALIHVKIEAEKPRAEGDIFCRG